MGRQRSVPCYHHPLFTSVLPGVGGLGLGFVLAIVGSVTAYHFATLFEGMDDPDLTPRQLTQVATIGAAIPPVIFSIGLLIGGALAVLYRRNLRRYQDLLVAAWLLSPKERRRGLTNLQEVQIYWPLFFLVLLSCGISLVVEGGAQTYLQLLTFDAGLVAGLGLTYHERVRIYERVQAALGPDAEAAGLSLGAKLLAVSVVVLLMGVAGYSVWFAFTIGQSVLELQEALSPLLPGPAAGPGTAP